jgi:cupin fold WbuC family metalloprotein
MVQLTEESDEVFYALEEIVNISSGDIDELKKKMIFSNKERIRICTHRAIKDLVHEMLIIHTNQSYVRPHKHRNKVESITVLEGEAKIIIFNDDGSIFSTIEVGDKDTGKTFYHRMNAEMYHMFIIQSEIFVFHEVTQGPFNSESMIFPEWAPTEFEHKFINKINQQGCSL